MFLLFLLWISQGELIQDPTSTILSLEVENYDFLTDGNQNYRYVFSTYAFTWTNRTSNSFSNSGAMRATKVTGGSLDPALFSYSWGPPQLSYHVTFKVAGTHYVWLRSGTSGSIWIALGNDGGNALDADPGWSISQPTLSRPVNCTLFVPAPGNYTVNVYMRLDNHDIDKLVFYHQSLGNFPTAFYRPFGFGAPKSPKSTDPGQTFYQWIGPSSTQTLTNVLVTISTPIANGIQSIINIIPFDYDDLAANTFQIVVDPTSFTFNSFRYNVTITQRFDGNVAAGWPWNLAFRYTVIEYPESRCITPPNLGVEYQGNCTVPVTTGTVCPLNCSAGYVASGQPLSFVCSNGMWTLTNRCNGVPCQNLKLPSNGTLSVSNGGQYPSTATYTCNAGYMLENEDRSPKACGTDGKWTPAGNLTCVGIPCEPIHVTTPLSYTSTLNGTYPSVATYSCLQGFTLTGGNKRSCLTTGAWNQTAPTCLATATVSATQAYAGASAGLVTVSFTPAASVEDGQTIQIILPTGFVVYQPSASLNNGGSQQNIPASSAVLKLNESALQVTLVGRVAAGLPTKIVLDGIHNAANYNATQLWIIKTPTEVFGAYSYQLNNAHTLFVANNYSMQGLSAFGVVFTPTKPLATNHTLTITFPTAFDFTWCASSGGCSLSFGTDRANINATASTAVAYGSNTVVVTIGGTISAFQQTSFVLITSFAHFGTEAIFNPLFGGPSGVFGIVSSQEYFVPFPSVTIDTLTGALYSVYRGTWTSKLPDFSVLTPIDSGITKTINPLVANPYTIQFGITFSGYIEFLQPGTYKLTLRSDDGSQLLFTEGLFIDNDGAHSPVDKSNNTVIQEPTRKFFYLPYFQNQGNAVLNFTWSINGSAATEVTQLFPYAVSPSIVSLTSVSGCPTSNTPNTSNCLADGQTKITVVGKGFQIGNTTVRVGSLPCTNVIVSSSTSLTCNIPTSLVGDQRLVVNTTTGKAISAPGFINYFPAPTFTPNSLRLNGGPASGSVTGLAYGGDEVEFTGLNFGINSSSPLTVFLGVLGVYQIPCNVTLRNTTWIKCTIGIGSGANLPFTVIVGGYIYSAPSSFLYSYPGPVVNVDSFALNGVPGYDLEANSTQGETITFSGNFLGNVLDTSATRVAVYYGPPENPTSYICAVDISGSNQTFIRCKTSRGAGTKNFFHIVVPNHPTLPPHMRSVLDVPTTVSFSYPLLTPVITQVTGCPDQDGPKTANCSLQGGTLLTITGRSFLVQAFISVSVGDGDCTNPQVLNDTTLTCTLPIGSGANRLVTILKDKYLSDSVPYVSYAPPYITSIAGCSTLDSRGMPSDCTRTGGDEITIDGENFGKDATVFIGGTSCINVTQTPGKENTQITCILPTGKELQRGVLVGVYAQFSPPNFYISFAQCRPGNEEIGLNCSPCPGGSFKADVGSGKCILCPPGKYANDTGATSCDRCPQGRYADKNNQTECTSCEPGTFSRAEAVSCDECAPGSIAPDFGSSECTPCGSGYAQPDSGETVCVECTPGTLQPKTGQPRCDSCAPGFYSNTTNATECTSCPPGTYADSGGVSMCSECEAGSFTSFNGAVTCQQCSPGYWSGDNATDCEPCGVGYFQSLAASDSCEPCPPGTYTVRIGADFCDRCPPGQYQPDQNATACFKCLAGTIPDELSIGCEPCDAGKFQSLDGQDTCDDCFAGRIVLNNATSCLPCGAGYYAAARETSCSECGPGYYSDDGSPDCILCPEGTYQEYPGADGCPSCEAGYYSSFPGNVKCEPCEVGKFQPSAGQSLCLECQPGFFADNETATTCEPCLPGFIVDATPRTVCTSCAEGEYQKSSGQAVCVKCEAGRYGNETSATTCHDCPAGTYSAASQLECTLCVPGKYQNFPGQSSCLPCSNGSYINDSMATECKPCPSGYAAPFPQQTSCSICSPGYFRDETTEGSRCKACEAGKFSNESGASTCLPCPINHYAPNNGSTSCMPCEQNKWTALEGQVNCTKCDSTKNQYLAKPLSQQPFCEPCPRTGAVCTDGGVFNDADYYLIQDKETGKATSQRCQPKNCLQGGQCAANRKNYSINPMCGECEPNYYEWSGQCVECDGVNSNLIFGFLVLSWVCVIVFHKAAQTTRGDTKIFLYFVQVVIIVFGPELDGVLSWLIMFNFNVYDVGGSSCVAPLSPIGKIALNMIIPIICIVQLVATVAAEGLYHFIRRNYPTWGAGPEIPKRWHWSYIRSGVGLVLFTYAQTTKAILQVFNCNRIGDTYYMVTSPGVLCDSAEYARLYAVAVTLVVCSVVATPICLLSFLIYHHHRNNFRTEFFAKKYGILTQAYTSKRFWWEAVAILRRTILISITVGFSDRNTMTTSLTIANLFFLVVHMRFRPFLMKIENLLENISLFLLTLITAILIDVGAPPLSTFATVILFILVVIPGLLLLIYVLAIRGLHLAGRRGPPILNKIQDSRRRESIVNNLRKKLQWEEEGGNADKWQDGEAVELQAMSSGSAEKPESRGSGAAGSVVGEGVERISSVVRGESMGTALPLERGESSGAERSPRPETSKEETEFSQDEHETEPLKSDA